MQRLFFAALFAAPIVFAAQCDYSNVTADFSSRDQLSEYANPVFHDAWGPKKSTYPAALIPAACDRIEWQQRRIIATAEKYIGLPYRHHHTPQYDGGDGPGLDCSNFSAWVYDYGLGIKFTGNLNKQASSVGRRLAPSEPLQPGDLLFIRTITDSRISHVVIYIDPGHIIDDHGSGVNIREFKGWYKNHLAYARRIIN